MKFFIIFLSFSVLLTYSFSCYKNEPDIRNGDLIFQESCSGEFGKAIKEVTHSTAGYNFTHVGIVWINPENDSIYVIEATHPKVQIIPLHQFLISGNGECKPKSVLGRINKRYYSLIPQAIEEAKKLTGCEYDDAFDLSNNKYYCSELIYKIFLKANHNIPVFQLNTMTFKSKGSKNFSSNWIQHFHKLHIPIPEGKLGINPGAMSRQKNVVDILCEIP